jgi:hypothetical protein
MEVVMVNRLSYPQFSLEPITEAISIISAGDVIARKEVLACDLWNVQGSLQGILLGNPDGNIVGATGDEVELQFIGLEGALLSCKDQCEAHAAAVADPLDPTVAAFDPMLIFQIIQMVLPLIQAWRQRRSNPTPTPPMPANGQS